MPRLMGQHLMHWAHTTKMTTPESPLNTLPCPRSPTSSSYEDDSSGPGRAASPAPGNSGATSVDDSKKRKSVAIEPKPQGSSSETASASATASTVAFTGEVAPDPKPKKPLSAFNVFFQHERDRILRSLSVPRDAGPGGGAGAAPAPVYDHDAVHCTLRRDPDVRVTDHRRRARPPPHGKIGFAALAKIVGARWTALDAESRAYYNGLAEADKVRYGRSLAAWHCRNEERKKRAKRADADGGGKGEGDESESGKATGDDKGEGDGHGEAREKRAEGGSKSGDGDMLMTLASVAAEPSVEPSGGAAAAGGRVDVPRGMRRRRGDGAPAQHPRGDGATPPPPCRGDGAAPPPPWRGDSAAPPPPWRGDGAAPPPRWLPWPRSAALVWPPQWPLPVAPAAVPQRTEVPVDAHREILRLRASLREAEAKAEFYERLYCEERDGRLELELLRRPEMRGAEDDGSPGALPAEGAGREAPPAAAPAAAARTFGAADGGAAVRAAAASPFAAYEADVDDEGAPRPAENAEEEESGGTDPADDAAEKVLAFLAESSSSAGEESFDASAGSPTAGVIGRESGPFERSVDVPSSMFRPRPAP